MKTTLLKIAAAFTLCITTFSSATAATEKIDGELEKGNIYSALFTVSGESGDLIGLYFKNNSPVGKEVLTNCLPGLICEIKKGVIRAAPDNMPVLKFKSEPSGWIEITRATNAYMKSAFETGNKTLKTRYGLLSVHPETRILLFKGKPVTPTIEGNSSLHILNSYEFGKTDVVLLGNVGGTACPELYQFVTISSTGVSVTPEFGTCSEFININTEIKNSITVVLPSFYGKQVVTRQVFRLEGGRLVVK